MWYSIYLYAMNAAMLSPFDLVVSSAHSEKVSEWAMSEPTCTIDYLIKHMTPDVGDQSASKWRSQ